MYRYPKALSTHLVSCHGSQLSSLQLKETDELFAQAIEREEAFFEKDFPDEGASQENSRSVESSEIDIEDAEIYGGPQQAEEVEEESEEESKGESEEASEEDSLEESEELDQEGAYEEGPALTMEENLKEELERLAEELETTCQTLFWGPDDESSEMEDDEVKEMLESYRVFIIDTEGTGGSKQDLVIEISFLDVLSDQIFSRFRSYT